MSLTRMYRAGPHPEDRQRINKQCGEWGHDWEYAPNGVKSCNRLYCNRVMRYTPNLHGQRVFVQSEVI